MLRSHRFQEPAPRNPCELGRHMAPRKPTGQQRGRGREHSRGTAHGTVPPLGMVGLRDGAGHPGTAVVPAPVAAANEDPSSPMEGVLTQSVHESPPSQQPPLAQGTGVCICQDCSRNSSISSLCATCGATLFSLLYHTFFYILFTFFDRSVHYWC